MSKIKDILNDPSNNVNIAKLAEIINNGRKIKYLEMLLRMIKNGIFNEKQLRLIKMHYHTNFNIPEDKITSISPIEILFLGLFKEKHIIEFQEFCDFNERGLIKDNDITKYKYFDQLEIPVKIANEKIREKELESQVKKIYEDDEWLLIRPLTLESSQKYGTNTKWCTVEKKTTYFNNYAKNGILIYIINRKTGLKIAAHKWIEPTPSQDKTITFWDDKDKKIDSLECGIPYDILLYIKNELLTYPIPNIPDNEINDETQKTAVFDEESVLPYVEMPFDADEEDPLSGATSTYSDVIKQISFFDNSDNVAQNTNSETQRKIEELMKKMFK